MAAAIAASASIPRLSALDAHGPRDGVRHLIQKKNTGAGCNRASAKGTFNSMLDIQGRETDCKSNERRRCRRCRGKLAAPTDNLHKAFCCRRCRDQHFRTRCGVCEVPARTVICKSPKCRREWGRNRTRYIYRQTVKSIQETLAAQALKTPSRVIGPSLPARSLALAALPLDPATASRIKATNKSHWDNACLLGPRDMPITTTAAGVRALANRRIRLDGTRGQPAGETLASDGGG